MGIELGAPPSPRGGPYVTAETGTDVTDGTGILAWQVRDAYGAALAGIYLVRVWYVAAAASPGVPALATGFTPFVAGNLYETVDANQELRILSATNGALAVIVDAADGAVYGAAELNGSVAVATVTISTV